MKPRLWLEGDLVVTAYLLVARSKGRVGGRSTGEGSRRRFAPRGHNHDVRRGDLGWSTTTTRQPFTLKATAAVFRDTEIRTLDLRLTIAQDCESGTTTNLGDVTYTDLLAFLSSEAVLALALTKAL
jgi:hypothetical protein